MPLKSSIRQPSRKLFKKGGADVGDICIQESINCSNYTQVLDEALVSYDVDDDKDVKTLYQKITNILTRGNTCCNTNIDKILDLLNLFNNRRHLYDNVINVDGFNDEWNGVHKKPFDNEAQRTNFENIFEDIAIIVKNFKKDEIIEIKDVKVNKGHHFQTDKFTDKNFVDEKAWDTNTLWGKYDLGALENKRTFITIDPTIIQLLIFDDVYENYKNGDVYQDVVYSLKLIIRKKGYLQLRYTTKLFPSIADEIDDEKKIIPINSKITDFANLKGFDVLNLSLGNSDIANNYPTQRRKFLSQYIKFYQFYKKCYTITENCKGRNQDKNLIDYQLKYISILGKARFGDPDIKKRTAVITDYVMANLIFASPTYGFMSGGYKGFKDKKFGITRSGYEIAKKYNRPVLTIMCQEGTHDSHQFSDATLIYGEHWGEDTIALSQLTDGAIVIAPFGGWTYVECLALLATKRIVGIYNDFYNILNYEAKPKNITDEEKKLQKLISPNLTDDDIIKIIEAKHKDKENNKHFFKFLLTEQNSIIDYYINYYFILLYLLNLPLPDNLDAAVITELNQLEECLKYQIKLLTYLKVFIADKNMTDAIKISNPNFILLINACNKLKLSIDERVNKHHDVINNLYKGKCNNDDTYQNRIPRNCDGIWTKPLFDLTELCTYTPAQVASKGGNKRVRKGGTTCTQIDDKNIKEEIEKCKINLDKLKGDKIFENLNNNIIFVFSDAMYLNMYLNENLNTTSFQKGIHDKINKLTSSKEFKDNTSFRTMRNLTPNEENNYLKLNRNIDGTFTEEGILITENIVREKYSFIIDDSCNNYTNLLENTQSEIKEYPGDIPSADKLSATRAKMHSSMFSPHLLARSNADRTLIPPT